MLKELKAIFLNSIFHLKKYKTKASSYWPFLFMMFFTSSISANELDTNDQMRYQSLIQEVRCLVCQNQSVAESNAELAKDLRREIKLQIQDGKTDGEIKSYLLERYGEFILYEPAFSQKTLFL